MSAPDPPTLRRLLRVWLQIGIQSFGGGATTLVLIRQALVERHGWIDEDDFTREWALCQMSPGINLLAFAARLGGQIGARCGSAAAGVALSVVGLMLPSTLITVGIAAAYARIARHPAVAGALHGVVPATVGLGLWTAWQMLRPLCRGGWTKAAPTVAIVAAAAAALAFGHLPVPVVLLAGGALGALLGVRRSAPAP